MTDGTDRKAWEQGWRDGQADLIHALKTGRIRIEISECVFEKSVAVRRGGVIIGADGVMVWRCL